MQQAPRDAFGRWGLPRAPRLDNGVPWGNFNDLPTALELWLVGLGVEVEFNPPRSPRDNAVVGRSHRTGQCWGDPQSCRGAEQLQGQLDEAGRIQREAYPSIQGRTRLEVFPGLRHSGRAYTPGWERRHWDEAKAREHLALHCGERVVSGQGRVSVYHRDLHVGAGHEGKKVWVQYDPVAGEWVFSNREGVYLSRQPAPEISRRRIVALDIARE